MRRTLQAQGAMPDCPLSDIDSSSVASAFAEQAAGFASDAQPRPVGVDFLMSIQYFSGAGNIRADVRSQAARS
eukprot:2762929-Karenia_brevis.AAC.1